MYKPVSTDGIIKQGDVASPQEHQEATTKTYWPAALRISWLLTILCFVLALIAGLEVGIKKLPSVSRTALDSIKEAHTEVASAFSVARSELLEIREPQTSGTNPEAYVPATTTITSRSSTRTSLRIASYADTTTPNAYVAGRLTSSSRGPSTDKRPVTFTSAYVATGTPAPSVYVPAPGVPNRGVFLPSSKSNQGVVVDWPKWQIFVGNYLPVLLAVALRIIWTPVLANARLIQPFLAMMRPDGVRMKQVLFSGYLSRSHNPVTMVLQRAWLSLATLLGLCLILLIQPFSSEVVFVDTKYCPAPDPDLENPCWPPRISIDPSITRALQALLAVLALVCIIVIIAVIMAPSPPLPMKPSTIAGIAAIAHHPILLHDFRAEDSNASTKDLKLRLPDRKYALQQYLASDGQRKFGVVPIAAVEYGPVVESTKSYDPKPSRNTGSDSRLARITSWRDVMITAATMIVCVSLLGVILAYYLDGSDSPFNRFFNSDTFGPRFILTSLATMASMGFGSLHEDVVLAAPFHRLNSWTKPATSTINLPKSSLPIITTFTFLRHLYLFPAAFSLAAVLADVLVILAPVIPFSPGRMWEELLISCYTCMGILGLMLLCIIGLIFWRKRPVMPRKPDTIGGVISYLCAGRRLEHASDEKPSLDADCTKYTYDRLTGTDGVTRWMIDAVRA